MFCEKRSKIFADQTFQEFEKLREPIYALVIFIMNNYCGLDIASSDSAAKCTLLIFVLLGKNIGRQSGYHNIMTCFLLPEDRIS